MIDQGSFELDLEAIRRLREAGVAEATFDEDGRIRSLLLHPAPIAATLRSPAPTLHPLASHMDAQVARTETAAEERTRLAEEYERLAYAASTPGG